MEREKGDESVGKEKGKKKKRMEEKREDEGLYKRETREREQGRCIK